MPCTYVRQKTVNATNFLSPALEISNCIYQYVSEKRGGQLIFRNKGFNKKELETENIEEQYDLDKRGYK